VASICSLEKL